MFRSRAPRSSSRSGPEHRPYRGLHGRDHVRGPDQQAERPRAAPAAPKPKPSPTPTPVPTPSPFPTPTRTRTIVTSTSVDPDTGAAAASTRPQSRPAIFFGVRASSPATTTTRPSPIRGSRSAMLPDFLADPRRTACRPVRPSIDVDLSDIACLPAALVCPTATSFNLRPAELSPRGFRRGDVHGPGRRECGAE